MENEALEKDNLEHFYFQKVRFKLLLILSLVIICFFSIALSVTVSGYDISVVDTYKTIINHILGDIQDSVDDFIVWDTILPRSLFAIIVGAGLAVAGVAMQNVMKNPLADSYTTGIASGSSLGMAIAMCLGISISVGYGSIIVLLMTFIMAIIPTALILILLPKRNTSPATIILIGISLSYFFSSFNTLILVSVEAETLAHIYNWQVGTLANITWDYLPIAFVITLIGSIFLMVFSNKLNVISLNDDEAKSLGVDVESYRMIILLVLSIMVAVVVAYAGVIGFVGLVAPHIIRSLIGSNNKFLIPSAMLLGSVLLILSDIACRAIRDSYMPAGLMMSLIGGPIFVFIILKTKNMW